MSFGKEIGQFFLVGFGMVGGIMLTRHLMGGMFGGSYNRNNEFMPQGGYPDQQGNQNGLENYPGNQPIQTDVFEDLKNRNFGGSSPRS
jgi:hypothetical protein